MILIIVLFNDSNINYCTFIIQLSSVTFRAGITSQHTISRLHFSETTCNNMRKRGKRNPDQKYFNLVVTLKALSAEKEFLVAAKFSSKLIVRVSLWY